MIRMYRITNQNEKNKVSSTLLSLRLDAQPTVTLDNRLGTCFLDCPRGDSGR